MNKRNKKTDRKSTLIAIVIIMFISVLSSAAEGEDTIGIIIAVAVAAAAIYAVIKKTAEAKKKEQGREEKVYTAIRPTAPAACDYGEANCDYSHDFQRRVKQLDGFLKNGTIDKAEYSVLLEKYRKNYEEHQE